MSPPAPPPALVDARVRLDLCATLRLNLSMAGVWLTDAQAAAAVDALVARLTGEWRARQLRRPAGSPPADP